MQAFAQGGAFPFAMAFSRDSGAGAARSPEAGLSSGRGRMAFFSRGTVSGADALRKRQRRYRFQSQEGKEKGLASFSHKSLKFMVRLERFELPAYRFVACCSIQLSYSRIRKKALSRVGFPVKLFLPLFFFFLCSGGENLGEGPRLLLRSAGLCRENRLK